MRHGPILSNLFLIRRLRNHLTRHPPSVYLPEGANPLILIPNNLCATTDQASHRLCRCRVFIEVVRETISSYEGQECQYGTRHGKVV